MFPHREDDANPLAPTDKDSPKRVFILIRRMLPHREDDANPLAPTD